MNHTSRCLKYKADSNKLLNEMSVDDVAEFIASSHNELSSAHKQAYATTIKEKNICGKVLALCELEDLKAELGMTFGDWLLFKSWLAKKRNRLEKQSTSSSYCYEATKTMINSYKPATPTISRQTSIGKVAVATAASSLSNIPEIIFTNEESADYEVAKNVINNELNMPADCSINEANDDGDDEEDNLLEPSIYLAFMGIK